MLDIKKDHKDEAFVARVLLISDLHYLSVPVGQQKGQGGQWWQGFMEKFIFNPFKLRNIERVIPKMIRKITRAGSFDEVIINGDVIECEYNERGMLSTVDCRAMEKIISEIKVASFSSDVFITAGDHDLGYRLALSSDPMGGISLSSLTNFQKVVGPLWQKNKIGGIDFLFLCSSIMIQEIDHLPKEQQLSIITMREEQRLFIIGTLKNIPEEAEILVFLHDPSAIKSFNSYIEEDKHRITIFCGHLHAKFALSLYKFLGRIKSSWLAQLLPIKIKELTEESDELLPLIKKYKLVVIPAPGGMLGFGGGLLILKVYKNAKFSFKYHRL